MPSLEMASADEKIAQESMDEVSLQGCILPGPCLDFSVALSGVSYVWPLATRDGLLDEKTTGREG